MLNATFPVNQHELAAQRAITSTWVLDEVRLAIQKGYKVLDILEVYEYEVTVRSAYV
jgi:diketogulonate reductase-like aldo/keto reductase